MSFVVHFESEGNGPPAEIRLRRLLKYALRGCGLRAMEVREQPQKNKGTPMVDVARDGNKVKKC